MQHLNEYYHKRTEPSHYLVSVSVFCKIGRFFFFIYVQTFNFFVVHFTQIHLNQSENNLFEIFISAVE